jgi:hypothetical protein
MAASRIQNIMTDSFLDGITGAALFGKLRIPGAPTVLVDEGSPVEAYPEYDALLNATNLLGVRPLRAHDNKYDQDAEKARMAKLYREHILGSKPIEGVLDEIQVEKRGAEALHGQTASFSRSKS